ncbi:hypothetical protein BsWGS_20171 [Bradybaena similaris]
MPLSLLCKWTRQHHNGVNNHQATVKQTTAILNGNIANTSPANTTRPNNRFALQQHNNSVAYNSTANNSIAYNSLENNNFACNNPQNNSIAYITATNINIAKIVTPNSTANNITANYIVTNNRNYKQQ